MTWIYDESNALKQKLSGLTITDVNESSRPVKVRFRTPENEIGQITYPMIIIEHVGIEPAHDREHRGFIQVPYAPEGNPSWVLPTDNTIDPTASPYWSEEPIPMNLDFQVTLYTRKVLHGMKLVPILSTAKFLPPRYGYLQVLEDGTIRSLEVLAGPEPGDTIDKDTKRLFTWTWMVRIYSEIFLSDLTEYTAVQTVQVRLADYDSLPLD